MTNLEVLRNETQEGKREKLIQYFSEWANIGDSDICDLTRAKEAFIIGTMSFDDFKEWDEERIEILVDEFLGWLESEATDHGGVKYGD